MYLGIHGDRRPSTRDLLVGTEQVAQFVHRCRTLLLLPPTLCIFVCYSLDIQNSTNTDIIKLFKADPNALDADLYSFFLSSRSRFRPDFHPAGDDVQSQVTTNRANGSPNRVDSEGNMRIRRTRIISSFRSPTHPSRVITEEVVLSDTIGVGRGEEAGCRREWVQPYF